MSAGAQCAPLQRGRNRNGEMRLQRWAASLQRLDAFATDGCIAVPRRDARRVIGATAKPLYPIDGKAVGLDRRSPRPPSSREGDRPQAVEGVLRRRKASVPIAFMPNILLFSDARQAYEAYEAYEAHEPIFLKKDRLFLIGNFINRRFSEISCAF